MLTKIEQLCQDYLDGLITGDELRNHLVHALCDLNTDGGDMLVIAKRLVQPVPSRGK